MAVALLVALAVTAATVGRLQVQRAILTASGRAVLQLAAVALVITLVLGSVVWSLVFTVVMFSVAVVTTSRRIGVPRAWPWAAVAMAAGVVPVLTIVFGTGAVPFDTLSFVPFAGIVIGGTMNAHSLAGRRVLAALDEQHSILEAALAIGLRSRDAVDVVARHLVPEALVPGMDQTRTVGLVTLPGAFVGVLLGGGTPVQAAVAQGLVLIGLLAAQTISAALAYQLIRRGRLVPPSLAPVLNA